MTWDTSARFEGSCLPVATSPRRREPLIPDREALRASTQSLCSLFLPLLLTLTVLCSRTTFSRCCTELDTEIQAVKYKESLLYDRHSLPLQSAGEHSEQFQQPH
jgi:hypothetical protein